jgi:hypothetical protein
LPQNDTQSDVFKIHHFANGALTRPALVSALNRRQRGNDSFLRSAYDTVNPPVSEQHDVDASFDTSNNDT